MILIVYDSPKDAERLAPILKNALPPIYAKFISSKELDKGYISDLSDITNSVLVYKLKSSEKTEALCRRFRAFSKTIKIGTILTTGSNSPARFKYIPSADLELADPSDTSDILAFLIKLNTSAEKPSQNDVPLPLKIMSDIGAAALLGYDLSLSKSEFRLLSFVFQYKDTYLPSSVICDACLGGDNVGYVPILVHSINKKAVSISGRKLIKCKKSEGYYLNPEM